MRDKYRRKVFTKIIFTHPVGLHTIDVYGCFQRTSILRNELLYYRARLEKQIKEKMALNIFSRMYKGKNLRRGG